MQPKIFSIVSLAASVLAAQAQYIAHDLGLGFANHINSSGTVVGSTFGSSQLAYSYSAGVMTTFAPLPGMNFGIAYCINDLGDISGSSGNSSTGNLQGYVYHMGVATPFSALGSSTYASAINNAGTIVGESSSHAFRYSQGTTTDLGTFGGPYSVAASINSSGVIVGSADTPQSTHAFRYANGTMTDLGSLDGRVSYAMDINDLGTIVGYSTVGGVTNSGYEHAFRYQAGVMVDLGTLAPGSSGSSEANAINSFGVIVGTSDAWGGSAWTQHAYIYRDGVMTDLSPFLAAVGLGGLSIAQDINDNGDIVGYALDASGNGHGFVLFAVPEPSTAALLALAGAIGLLCRRSVR